MTLAGRAALQPPVGAATLRHGSNWCCSGPPSLTSFGLAALTVLRARGGSLAAAASVARSRSGLRLVELRSFRIVAASAATCSHQSLGSRFAAIRKTT